jgi:antitoxin YefM
LRGGFLRGFWIARPDVSLHPWGVAGSDMRTVTYTEAREKLASLWNEVVSSREAVVIKWRGHADVALLPADELSSLMETVGLLRSPANGRRLLGALERARSGKGRTMTTDDLRKRSGVSSATRC